MKAIALIRSLEERARLRSLLSGFDQLEFQSKPEELTASLVEGHLAQLYIVDEQVGDVKPVLEHIAAFSLREPQAPVVLVLVQARARGEAGRAAECDRMDAYGELGVEQFLYRPFSTQELEKSVKICESWVRALPAWVQLMRAGRLMFRNKKFETIVPGLERLHALMPDQVSPGLLLARCLLDLGDEASLAKATSVLEGLRARHPTSFVVCTLLVDSLLRERKFGEAARSSLALLGQRWSQEFFCIAFEAVQKTCERSGDVELWYELLAHARRYDLPVTREARIELYRKIAYAAVSHSSLDRWVGSLETDSDMRIHLVSEMTYVAEALGPIPTAARLWEWILAVDPGHPKALAASVKSCLAGGRLREAESLLATASYSGRTSVEYHASMNLLKLERRKG